MKSNIGGVERAIRILLGLALVILAALGIIGWWGWLGIALLVTGFFRFCPLYTLLGISSCRCTQQKKDS